jgi:hypothetical protein
MNLELTRLSVEIVDPGRRTLWGEIKGMKAARWIVSMSIASTTAHAAVDIPEPVKWGWQCASTTFYTTQIFPDGKHQSKVDDSSKTSITMRLKYGLNDLCSKGRIYFIEIVDLSGPFDTRSGPVGDLCKQVVVMDFETRIPPDKEPELRDLQVSIGKPRLQSLEVARDDVEWRFVLSSTSITTEKRARELRITAPPNPLIKWQAKADIYFITGECILNEITK